MLKNLKTKKIQLKRNLVKTIKRGNPWLYKDAIDVEPNAGVCLAKVEYKKEFVAWGFYDPNSVLAVRILSLDKEKPPGNEFLISRLNRAISLRKSLFESNETNCFRLINGEGDLLPGLICDLYSELAVLQVDGEGPELVWDLEQISRYLVQNTTIQFVYFKARNSTESQSRWLTQSTVETPILVKENSVKFWVDFVNGQKTGFFLDQRDNRKYISQFVNGKTFLNLFSYTGGFSVYAGVAGASMVTSVDIAKPACEFVEKNWQENTLSKVTGKVEAMNVFDFLEQAKNSKQKFQVIMVDPPSFAPNEKQKPQATKSYIEVFSQAISILADDGDIFFSSCSSHINLEEFIEICQEAVSKSRKRAQIIYVGAQGSDHPFLLNLREMQYLKFLHLKCF